MDRDVISNMITAGSSLTSIAKSLGISRQSVHRIKAELGL
ncbi:helix-turn-helix domain-containing protein [Thalassobium sp. R2A62]